MARRPNILIYCTDQQRADLMGCMGHPLIRTPHFDALARRGTLLRSLFIQNPVCMPSRASIMTGRYPSTHGVTDVGYELPTTEQTLGDFFGRAGYHTAVVGRTHLRCSRPHPVLPATGYYGFQECFHQQCYWTGLDPYGDYLKWIQKNHPTRYEEAAMPTPVDRTDAHGSSWSTLDDDKTMTAWVTTQSLDVLRRHRRQSPDRPILLWAGTWDPHSRFVTAPPWDRMYPPESIPLPVRREGELKDLPPHYQTVAPQTSWRDKSVSLDRAIQNTLSIYWGMISHIDDQFGRLMRGLEELGMADDTIVLFTSDHGEMAGDHWIWSKGAYWFDCALRVPGIVAGPGVRAGRSTEAIVEQVDIAPTLLELAGLPAAPTVEGRSCAPLLRGDTDEHRPDALTEYRDHRLSGERMWSIRTATHRLTHYCDKPYGELFDLRSDPQQLRNLWDRPEHAEVKHQLRARLLDRVPTPMTRPDTRPDWW